MSNTPLTANKSLSSGISLNNSAPEVKEGDLQTKEELMFAKFTCTRSSMQVITDTGTKLAFIDRTLLIPVEQEDVIEYLQDQIKRRGIPGLAFEGEVPFSDRNPMAQLEAKMRKQIQAEVEAKVLAKLKAAETGASGLATSKNVAS